MTGDPVGDAVQPAPQRVAHAHRAGLAHQHEEGGLEGVVGRVLVAEQVAADAQHHRPVPCHERLEARPVVAPAEEAVEQLRVGQPGDRAGGEDRAQPALDIARPESNHRLDPPLRSP